MIDDAKALHALVDLTQRLSQERSLVAGLRMVSDATLELLPGDHASVRVLDHTRTELLCQARSGTGQEHQPVTFRVGQGVAGWVVENGEVARIDDTVADRRFLHVPEQGFAIRAILGVPLWSAGEVVGVLATTSANPGVFSDRDEAFTVLLANCVVPAIEKTRLARLAITDPQTMAFNREYLRAGLQGVMNRRSEDSEQTSVLVMNLDHFKRINEAFGNAAGDRVLRAFADCVRSSTRDDDVIVRRGADEFVLIMPKTVEQHARVVADRIHRAIQEQPIELDDGCCVTITVSIGGASWNRTERPDALEKRAAAAMFTAKLHGRNRVHFDDSLAVSER